MTKKSVPAIVLGVNYYIGLSAIRALGRAGVNVIAMDYDPKSYGFFSRFVTESVIIPNIKQDGGQKLLNYLKEFGKNRDNKPILIPAADEYAIFMSKYGTELLSYFDFPHVKDDLVANLVSKRELYQLAQKYEIPMPYTCFPQDEENLIKQTNNFKFPCIIKPEFSHEFVKEFREKVFVCHNNRELLEKFRWTQSAGISVMVQQIIPGPDDNMYTYNAYFDHTYQPKKIFTNQKKRQFPIKFGASVFTESVFVPDLIHLGEKFLCKLGYHGIVEIEFKQDAISGKYYMIEVNPRLTNFNNVILTSGLNFPMALYHDMMGEKLTKEINQEQGLKFVYLYEDIKAALAYIRINRLTYRSWLSSYKGPVSFAIFDLGDIKPSVVFMGRLLGKAAKKLIPPKFRD